MGNVILKIKLMPCDATTDMEKLKEDVKKVVPEYADVKKMDVVPIAFGLKALMLHVIMPDQSPDELIEKLEGIEGVANVSIDELSLI
ncbi:MAG: elongation factor 1-beta [Thermoplasmata archaeon]|nr:elongation factor 1-beta [Thermoplasmata archaeon]